VATLKKSIASLKRFRFEAELLRILRDNDNLIIDLNTDDQLFKFGIDSEGNKLQAYRSAAYAQLKAQLNPNHVTDLKLEGDFYKGMRVDASKFPVFMENDDPKAAALVQKYGEAILGLTDENMGELSAQILEEVIQSLRKKALGIP
jgi:hypothetical protein